MFKLNLIENLVLGTCKQASDLIAQRKFKQAKQLIGSPSNSYETGLLAFIAVEEGNWELAEKLARKAICNCSKQKALFHYCLGTSLARQGRSLEAEPELRKALALAPDKELYQVELCLNLIDIEKNEEALDIVKNNLKTIIQSVEKGLFISQTYNLIFLYIWRKVAKTPEENAALEKVLKYLVDSTEYPVDLRWEVEGIYSSLLFETKQYSKAWKHIEVWEMVQVRIEFLPSEDEAWQSEMDAMKPIPFWRGESLVGKNILLHSTSVSILSGLGDDIMFLRFLPQIAALGGNIFLGIKEPLRQLAVQLPVNMWTKELSDIDISYRLPLSLIPARVETTENSLPIEPYLRAETELVFQWKERITKFSGLKVGLVWRSADDDTRSIKAEEISRLLLVLGVTFFSLQVHREAANDLQIIKRQGKIIDLAPYLIDFRQTAAAIAALDLVITVDTSVANLCGAMGRSDWIMFKLYRDFRWPTWYPSIRPFSQVVSLKWDSVLDEVIEQLKIRAALPRN